MNSQIQFIGTSPADLIQDIAAAIIPKLREQLTADFQPKQPIDYLTRSEVCKLLKIDISTLHRWRKENVIPSYGMGNRVYFKRSEVEQILNHNQLSGQKKGTIKTAPNCSK